MGRAATLRLVGTGPTLQLRATGNWSSRPLDAIQESARASAAVEKFLRAAVADARRGGCTWSEIGIAIGVSRQAAWERFSGEE